MPDSYQPIAVERPALSAPEAEAIATLGYIYGYPLVLMDVTRSLATTPFNRFAHVTVFPDDKFTDVVSPNVDTLYSTAWLELSREPIVLDVPEMGTRYYMMPLLDAWTNVFASPGTRTTGNGKGAFAIVGPGWRGNVPASVEAIQAPTNMVFLIGRTYTAGKRDYDAVHAVQREYRLTPLSQWVKSTAAPGSTASAAAAAAAATAIAVAAATAAAPTTPPVVQVEKMNAEAFFARLARLMKPNPPTENDTPIAHRLASLGIIPGEPFDLARLPASIADAIEGGVAAARARIAGAPLATLGKSANGWHVQLELGRYGTDYERRAMVAHVGLGANLAQDAVYPMTDLDVAGQPLSGEHRYVIRFPSGGLPPVKAFWSVTLYDERHFLPANALGRYALGDRDALHAEPDGSVELLVQRDDPGPERRANWLPAPAGAFNLIMRLYQPKPAVLDGGWRPPPVVRV
jgi:hypothetical protein